MSVCLFCSQCWSSAEAKKLALLVRALNFNVGLQQITVTFITTLENISDVCSALSIDESLVQTGVCGFRKKTIGMLSMCELRIVCEIHAIISMKTGLCLEHIEKSQAPKSLDDEACGLVLLRCGGERQLNDRASNLFIYDFDQPCLDKGTGKVVNTRQRPVAFLQKLTELFTNLGDWILDGLSGTGMLHYCTLHAQISIQLCKYGRPFPPKDRRSVFSLKSMDC